ncbi:MAG: rod shape-determining protein RodA [Holosporales bacterium]|jgi:rod shape determining protein RodA|nr:rod shape-determining protein RodA [Holosporales bacterium]
MRNVLRKLKFLPILPFTIIIVITFFALLILYSINSGTFSPWCFKQFFKLLIGISAFFVGFLINPNFWKKHAYAFFIICLVVLAGVATIGKISMGAQRWINLYFFNFQPSELMRISLVFVLAKYFSCLTQEEIKKTSSLIIPIGFITIPVVLVLLQPDFGTAMLTLFVGGSIFFACGVQIWKFFVTLLCGVITTPILWSLLHEYQKNRVSTFLSPELDPNGTGYHIIQSKIALGAGGFWGKGLGYGSQCQLNFLPEKQTDFIFSALGEELGFWGCIILISLYATLLICNLNVIIKTKDSFNRIVVFGINSMLFFYICINISMVCGLVPVVGIPLPFFSYGGSSLVVLMFSQGITFSIGVLDKLKSRFSYKFLK